jgi:2-dehydropantoate 2-reductase
MTTPPLSILVVGAGAIGSYVGGSLALRGQRVVFLDRPETVSQIRAQGLRLRFVDGEHALTPVLVDSIKKALELGPFDAGIFSVKSYHTESAIVPLIPFADQIPPLICLQNGVDNEPVLEEALGTDKVIHGTVTTAIGRPMPGTVAVERLRGLGLAAAPESTNHDLMKRIKTTMDKAGLRATLYPNPADMKWSKLMTNLTGNATSAILEMTPGEVFAHPSLVRVEIAQQREVLRVMRTLGVRVTSLPGTPVRLFAFAVTFLPVQLMQPLLARAIGRGRGGKMPSLYIDLQGGSQQSEVTALNGAVAAHGARVGIHAPVNQMLNDTLLKMVQGELPKNYFARQPDKFLAHLSYA